MSYKEDLKIDKHRLDFEWERQAQLYMKWAEAYAQAVLDRDRAKELLDVVRAELDSKIRKSPADFGFDKKPTESAITNTVVQQEEYRKAYDKLIQAQSNMNILAGAKEAMSHKKKALEGITQLMVSGFYAEPNIPAKAKDRVVGEVTRQLKKGLRRNKRLVK